MPKLLTQFGQEESASVNEYDSNQLLAQCRIKSHSIAEEVVQGSGCFHTRKTATGGHESEQPPAVGVFLLERRLL